MRPTRIAAAFEAIEPEVARQFVILLLAGQATATIACMADTLNDYVESQDARIDETYEVHKALVKDLDELNDQANKQHQGARRAYVRGVFALIEAMTYRLKASALEIGRASVTPARCSLLEERDYGLNDNGTLQIRNRNLKTLPNVKFTLAMLVKASGV